MAARMEDISGKLAAEHQAIELLVIAPSLSMVNELASMLRNAGIAVHPRQIQDLEQLTDTLSANCCDLILAVGDPDHSDIHATIGALRQSDSDAILIYLSELDDRANPVVEIIGQGVADIVNPDNKLHLQHVVRREYHNLMIRRQLEEARNELAATELRCTTLMECSHDAIAYVHDGMHIRANPVYLQLFGYIDEEELADVPLLDLIEPDELPKVKKFMRRLPSLADETPLDTQCRNTNGKSFQARMEFSPAHMDGEPCTQITIRDQGNTNELEEKLRELQRLDLHTGLLNRDTFVQECDERLSGSDREHAHLMIVSLDNVQEVYHISGIKAADSVVLDVSGIIRSLVPDSAICAHVSDSSFGILIKGSELGTAESLGEEIRQAVEEHIFENTKRFVAPTCSIGIVACGDYARTAGHEYIGLAFRACESASSMGGNRVCVYNNSLIDEECLDEEEPGVEAGNVLALTRQALENDGFSLVYQPIVSLQGDTRENYAVMLRLPGENGKTIMPDEFLKPAENADLMSQIDRWVIKNAIEELARQRKEGRKINFFLNVSSQGIQDQEFLLWVCDCLRDCQAKGAWIVFQLKEADVRTNIQASKQLIEGLRKIRCQVALDRFGRTPQSRGLLKHIKFDFVKLAPDFMDNLADNQEKQEELGAANELAQSFDIKTIATAVEDANSLAVLWTIGVNYIQGYFLQDPSDTITFDFNGA